MKRLALAVALLASAPAAAWANSDTVFSTVDDASIDWNASKFSVTGIVSGETSARTVTIDLQSSGGGLPDSENYKAMLEYCERAALLSMNRPGRYLFTMSTAYLGSALISCKLKRQ